LRHEKTRKVFEDHQVFDRTHQSSSMSEWFVRWMKIGLRPPFTSSGFGYATDTQKG
jgi:hypothetical protein